jgi:LysR family hca operon transcriptional activator
VLRKVIEEYAAKVGIKLKQTFDAETLSAGMSLVASADGFTLVPIYVQNSLLPSVVARPLHGEIPTIDLVMGYNKSNTSSLLKKFLLRADELASYGPRAKKLLQQGGKPQPKAIGMGR